MHSAQSLFRQKTARQRLRNPRLPLISRHPRSAANTAAADDDTDRGSIEKRLTRRQEYAAHSRRRRQNGKIFSEIRVSIINMIISFH